MDIRSYFKKEKTASQPKPVLQGVQEAFITKACSNAKTSMKLQGNAEKVAGTTHSPLVKV